jgi:hypothetical protein
MCSEEVIGRAEQLLYIHLEVQQYLSRWSPVVLKQLMHLESRLTYERKMVTGVYWENF